MITVHVNLTDIMTTHTPSKLGLVTLVYTRYSMTVQSGIYSALQVQMQNINSVLHHNQITLALHF